MSPRTILHADLDAFFASVAQRDDPSLRGLPIAVGGGVVLAASYEARAFGVKGGMGGGKARQLCPQLLTVRSDFGAYVEASKQVRSIFRELAPRVEPMSIDEAYLEAGPGDDPRALGAEVRRRVRDEVGLPITVGGATTRALAKIAGAAAKPDGLLVLDPEEEPAFLRDRAVDEISGVGEATARKLRAHGLLTVGHVAAADELALMALLGKAQGRWLHAVAHNRELRRVRVSRPRRSVGAQRALGRRPRSPEELDAVLAGLAERIAGRLRAGRTGRTVVLRLRFGDYEKAARSRTLPRATGDAATILTTARALLREAGPTVDQRGLRLLGLTLTGLEHDPGQLVLELEG